MGSVAAGDNMTLGVLKSNQAHHTIIDRTSFENIKISIKLPNSTEDGYYKGSVDDHAVSSSAVCRSLDWQTQGSGYNFVKPES